MPIKKAKDLAKGEKIILDNVELTVSSIEVSKIGKFGKAKCRIEALNNQQEKKIFIVLADDDIQVK